MARACTAVSKSEIHGGHSIIFVTVGNHYLGFPRLLQWVDEIAGETGEKTIIQGGSTVFRPRHAEFFSYAPQFDRILKLTRDARWVVSHAGAGSILTTLGEGTPLVCVPRLKKFHEHIDDHQLELSNALRKAGRVQVAGTKEELSTILRSQPARVKQAQTESPLVASLRQRIIAIGQEVSQ